MYKYYMRVYTLSLLTENSHEVAETSSRSRTLQWKNSRLLGGSLVRAISFMLETISHLIAGSDEHVCVPGNLPNLAS